MNPFLPEDSRAPTVHKKALTFYILVIAGCYVFLNFVRAAAPGVLGFASNIFVDDIVTGTNAYRQQNGLTTLRLDPELCQAAQQKAEDMFADDYWAHVAPDGTTPWSFITSAGYDYIYAGENLAKDFQKSDAVVLAWMESPTHRQNILNDKFRDIGVAVVNGELDGYETTLVVQMFGQKPAEMMAAAPEVLSQPEEAGQGPAVTALEEAETSSATTPPLVEIPAAAAAAPTRPPVDVFDLTRGLSLALGTMVLGFFTVDTWEARRRGLTRLSGHTVAHFAILLLLLGVTWMMKPGAVL
jgi:hypothetical protein